MKSVGGACFSREERRRLLQRGSYDCGLGKGRQTQNCYLETETDATWYGMFHGDGN